MSKTFNEIEGLNNICSNIFRDVEININNNLMSIIIYDNNIKFNIMNNLDIEVVGLTNNMYLGFSATTGGATNIHEIKDVK